MAETEVKCRPQLTEVVNTIPASCGSSYTYEQPLLLQTWEQDSIVTTVTNIQTNCSGGVVATPNPNGSVNLQLSGTPEGCDNAWLFDVEYTSTCKLPPEAGGGIEVIGVRTFEVFGGKPTGFAPSVYPPSTCNPGATFEVVVEGGGTQTVSGQTCPPNGCSNFIQYPPSFSFGNVRPKPGTTPCETLVTIRHEGCSKAPPPGTYPDGTPPGGGSSGGGGSPGGSPPSGDETPNPPPQPPGGGFGGGGGSGAPPPGSAPPPGNNPPPPGSAPPPPPPINTSQPSGSQVVYPDETVLTPAPTPQFPTLIVFLPGSEPEQIPWNGYAVYPGSEAATNVVVGTTYPALYVSPMMAQRVFHNWKSLKHILLQFDNREGVNIHTAFTTSDAAQRGKALQQFNATIGVIYNDEFSDEVIQDLYRYDPALWSSNLFLKHYSPKQIDDVVSFKEALLGTSYSYQVAVFSSDTKTWKLVGWQIEGKPKGKRRSHSRD